MASKLQRGRVQLNAEMPEAQSHLREIDSAASTGPRSIERGDNRSVRCGVCSGVSLQRGRVQLNAEITMGHSVSTHTDKLQRGRVQLNAEIIHAPSRPFLRYLLQRGRVQLNAEIRLIMQKAVGALWTLQRGRVQLNAEIPLVPRHMGAHGGASTGPRSIERGDCRPT